MLSRLCIAGIACFSVICGSSIAYATCHINGYYGDGTHFLVNGRWKELQPEIFFSVPGAALGNGTPVAPYNINNSASTNERLRFRLNVDANSSAGVRMYFDSSAPLSCVDCSSVVSIPFSELSWTRASSQRGASPGDGQLNGGVQSLIYAAKKTDNVFLLQFNFANSQVYPAGTYKGTFHTRGIPE